MSLNHPPCAKRVSTTFNHHGIPRDDPYFWMKERDHPDVIAYLEAENQFCANELQTIKDLEDKVFEEITGKIKKDDSSFPYREKGDYFYERYEKDLEHAIYCRKKAELSSPEEILLDANARAKGFAFYDVESVSVSSGGRFLAFAEDTSGGRVYTIRFKDIETEKVLDVFVPKTTGDLVWSEVEGVLFYTVPDEKTLRWHKVFQFDLKTERSTLVYEEPDEKYYVQVSKSLTDRYIFISSDSKTTTEVRFLRSDQPNESPQLFLSRRDGHEYYVEDGKDEFFILSNHEAKNFKLLTAPTTDFREEKWVERIPHREDVYLEDVEVFENFFALEERSEGLTHLRLVARDGSFDRHIRFQDPVYVAESDINTEYSATKFRYSYESMTTPESVYDYDLSTQESHLLKQDEVIGGYNSKDYVSERIWVPSRDGRSIPVSLVYRRDTKKSPETPLLLYGYGSYGSSEEPSFGISRLSLLDRGFIFAKAHIRGGAELGRQWYDEGKLLNKKNTFFDFIDVSDYLVSKNYTSTDHLYAMGGSAGGLLIGAVINMRPDLYRGVVAAVPFVDVINTMLDDTVPLTTFEYEEWGNPNEKQYFEYMLSYSPYDNVLPQSYPHILVTCGYHDSQVQYWEPAKWVAKLRSKKTDDNLLLLYTDMQVGHSGPSGRFAAYRLIAKEFSFLLMLEGMRA